MELLIVRHAIAFERDPHRWRDDSERPLSPQGMDRARKAAAGLKRLTERPGHVLTSPFVRARQTAKILHEVASWPQAIECAELSRGAGTEAVLTRLGKESGKLIAIVGHEPDLGELLSVCLTGAAGKARVEMKKIGVACLSFKGVPRAGRATLLWLATPQMLRAARRSSKDG